MATFVLVPGAWLGAWAWEETARALQELGHTVLALTLTGLGERADQATRDTDLDTHVDDIVASVEQADLREVTLVAHSYAAAPVTAAAGRLGARLKRLVYLDSAPFAEGMRMLDLMPSDVAEQLSRQVADHGEGWRLSMPPFEALGSFGSLDGLGEEQRGRVRALAAPQPFGTFVQRLTGPDQADPGVDRVLVACNDFRALMDAEVPMLAFLNQPPWRRFDLHTGHWPMLSVPAELAGVLHAAVA
ncbi:MULTISPECIES: alpha/beta fold hydrolase [Kitasatospora]|jgi:pimeloyl-ACP methyl ester carboxylesterase|uniref:alpha/beta fold hydrolase n=1 Tax=Kitasatospora TaxID=2063 RepID=UPI000C6FE776|nr:alpha/beta fold hydrolase [Kitasatospora sp. GP30]MDH6139930.1 pimeloyl-ACP methyl ester carboxylesterase [Kitasatospora sp. GP30]